MSTPPLHPRIAEILAALESAQLEQREALAGLSPDMIARQPAEGRWSIPQVVEHILVVEDGAGRLIGGMLKQLEGTVDEESDPIAPTLERYQIWNPITKVEAPDRVKPSGMAYPDAVAAQETARARLITALTNGSGRALQSMSFPHPIFGPLTGYQWALLTAQHQRRHLVQIRQIAAAAS